MEQIKVFLQFSSNPILVGQLVLENRSIYFKYDDQFLEAGLEISPFKLKLFS